MKNHDEALQVLLIVRRRLLKRMASVVVENRDVLLNGGGMSNNPLSKSEDLTEIIRNLNELDGAIAGLADYSTNGSTNGEHTADSNGDEPAIPECMFSNMITLVCKDRLEEASRDLSKTLHMPLDRAITATRFFSRSLKANPSLAGDLYTLCQFVTEWPEGDCVKMLIKTFGFQAVESTMALQALRARMLGTAQGTPEQRPQLVPER